MVDEAYHEYVEDEAYASMIDLVKQGKNIIVTRTFSKIFGLAGLRIGYGIVRSDYTTNNGYKSAMERNKNWCDSLIPSFHCHAFPKIAVIKPRTFHPGRGIRRLCGWTLCPQERHSGEGWC